MIYPESKKFAFSVFDDTDGATVENVKPVYDLLSECGLKTTKSVWIYPSRGNFQGSGCILDEAYRNFVCELKKKDFEIALHNVGDGLFTRDEIIKGFEIFKNTFGSYPAIHTNHVSNPDNLYWWDKRFEWPFNLFYKYLTRRNSNLGGELPGDLYWGDLSKNYIKYIRNLTFNDINTLARDPKMPYLIDKKSDSSQYWFSSSDGHTVEEFIDLISERNIKRLADEGGTCIVYTHFSRDFVKDGVVHKEFERRIRKLSTYDGYFKPVSQILDHLALRGTDDPGYFYRLITNIKWGMDRINKKIKYGR